MGMLATLMNGIALNHYLTEAGAKPRLVSAVPCPSFVESYTFREAKSAYNAGEVVLFREAQKSLFTQTPARLSAPVNYR